MNANLARSVIMGLALSVSPVVATTRYVDLKNPTPTPPYLSWAEAANSIQDAIDAAVAGDVILVTNGLYQTGQRIVNGSMYNRVVVDKAVTVQSVNGPSVTVIEGFQLPGTTNGDGAVRCVYLTNNAVLAGFTLTNGATRTTGATTETRGGGVYCRAVSAIVSNCVLTANAASAFAGGAYQGTFYSCTITGNVATNGGGTYSSTLINCTLTGNRALISGGGANSGSLSNCVLSSNLATNGGGTAASALTNCTISGNRAFASGGGANGGTLVGCKLEGNAATNSGGGAFNCALINCSLLGNTASSSGGGLEGGTLLNCVLQANSARFGGGLNFGKATNCVFTANTAWESGGAASGSPFTTGSCLLLNCTVVGNSAFGSGGGTYGCLLTNSIVSFNTAGVDGNTSVSWLYYCCTTPSPWYGASNLLVDPQLASVSHLSAASPCRGAGASGVTRGTDIDGEAWATPPAIGCDEYRSGSVTGAVSVAIQPDFTTVAVGMELNFRADIAGRLAASRWEFNDGTIISNRPLVSRSWNAAGTYPVVLRAYNESYPVGISATVTVQVVWQPIHYVSIHNVTPLAPYSSWATAATNIQDAVDAVTVPGALILVSNGVYATGARVAAGTVSNRLVVMKPAVVRSLNGPAVTAISGYQVPGATFGDAAVRCVFLGPGVVLGGFTLTNGATTYQNDAGFSELDEAGGGFYCAAPNVAVSNCVIANNAAVAFGGGGRGGTLIDCVLRSNYCSFGGSRGGGTYGSIATNCAFVGNAVAFGSGGGAYGGVLSNCAISNNIANSGNGGDGGGGVASATLDNCQLVGNSSYAGGGAKNCTLFNCLLTGNSGGEGGGANYCAVSNCVVTGNFAQDGGGVYAGTTLWTTISQNTATNRGGGAAIGELSNCVISQNSAGTNGGGAFYGSATNCAIVRNAVRFRGDGGGGYGTVLRNCTLTGNSAKNFGGSFGGVMQNCILYYNQADTQPNWGGEPQMDFCCTTPQPTNGVGHITSDPQLSAEFRLSSLSPCRSAGSAALATGVDIDGEAWPSPPAIGCDTLRVGAVTGGLTVGIQTARPTVAVGFPLELVAQVQGRVSDSRWEFGDGTVSSNRAYASHVWSSPGNYAVILRAYNESNPGGISATAMVQVVTQPVHYVRANSLGALPPYASWATAASNIQDAVDAANVPGALVLVSNGVYALGARRADDSTYGYVVSNRVAVTKPITLRSLNGPDVTIIQGEAQVRCVYLTNQAALLGFTLTNGLLPTISILGGGVWCESYSSVVSNCVLTGNTANGGGGVYFGTIDSCTLTGNRAGGGGGAQESRLNRCVITNNMADSLGGGVFYAFLTNCVVVDNWALYYGGGAYEGSLNNCLVIRNRTGSASGGGAYSATLNNCTVVSNTVGGGVARGGFTSCIIYYNSPTNYLEVSDTMHYTCTTPFQSGAGNFTNAPMLGNDFRLTSISPCINSGNNASAPALFDLDGNPRVVAGTVDVGAYEFQSPGSILSYAWAQQYGLAVDGSADYADTDSDGMSNYGEWRSDTTPTDALSVLRMISATNTTTGANVTWQSVVTRRYWLERSTNLGVPSPFQTVATNLPGVAGLRIFSDSSATNGGPYFYRVGVQ